MKPGLFGLGLALLLGVGALATPTASTTQQAVITQVRGGHKRDGLVLRQQQRQQQQLVASPWSRLMQVQGGIAQSKHADLYTEAIGTGIITASAALIGKTDLPGTYVISL